MSLATSPIATVAEYSKPFDFMNKYEHRNRKKNNSIHNDADFSFNNNLIIVMTYLIIV